MCVNMPICVNTIYMYALCVNILFRVNTLRSLRALCERYRSSSRALCVNSRSRDYWEPPSAQNLGAPSDFGTLAFVPFLTTSFAPAAAMIDVCRSCFGVRLMSTAPS